MKFEKVLVRLIWKTKRARIPICVSAPEPPCGGAERHLDKEPPASTWTAQSRPPRPTQDAVVQPVIAANRAVRSILAGETSVSGLSCLLPTRRMRVQKAFALAATKNRRCSDFHRTGRSKRLRPGESKPHIRCVMDELVRRGLSRLWVFALR